MSDLNWDFHCHSTASDGLLPAAEVARRAAGNGVQLLALTDHDDLAGLPAARAAAEEMGMGLVNGVEVSIEWEGLSIHVVGLGFDVANPVLNEGLAGIRSGRVERARRMAEALDAIAIRGAFEGAMAYAENPNLISRAHFARYLVQIGLCKDVHNVFDNYLTPGKPGYVEHRWASLEDAVSWIRTAGGTAVVAHPGRYKISNAALRRFLGQFKDAGGEGIEVVTGSHSPDQIHHFARLARHYGFLASRGSDFHGPEESYTDLGRLSPLPDGLTPICSRFV
ncbi:MAG: 3',5'-nucleoside bisphosphate phosphatase [Pseudomonadota bacterium]